MMGAMMCAALCTVALAGLTACMGDKGVAPVAQGPSATLGVVRVSPLNAVMAVGDTMSVHLTGRTLTGESVTTFDSIQYVLENSTDSLRASVSSSGVVTALTPSGNNSPVLLQVVAFKGGVARADQVIIQVTATAVPGATLSIQPVAPDSNRLCLGCSKRINPVIRNPTTGQRVSNPSIRFEYGPGDSTKFRCYSPNFEATATLTIPQLNLPAKCGDPNRTGQRNIITVTDKGTGWIVANVLVYGVPLRDSVQYTLTNQPVSSVQFDPWGLGSISNGSTDQYLAPGGLMYFQNGFPPELGTSVTWTFDNPDAVTADDPPSDVGGTTGNVVGLTGYQLATRRFMTPGVYNYTATLTGTTPPWTSGTITGRIHVE